jgi:uncharacterized protein YuzE
MVTTDTVEGMINGTISYHYDVFADVLYLRLTDDMETPSLAEQTDDGLLELHEETTGRLIGITIVSWWKRFGTGSLPDSLRDLQTRIEPWSRRVAA